MSRLGGWHLLGTFLKEHSFLKGFARFAHDLAVCCFIGVPDDQDIDGFIAFRQFKCLTDQVGAELTNPDAAETQVSGGQHQMGRDNTGIDVGNFFAVVFTLPDFLIVRADDDCQRCPKGIGGLL